MGNEYGEPLVSQEPRNTFRHKIAGLFSLALLMVFATTVRAEEPTLEVAISPDLPPYIFEGATSGLEVDILQSTLPGYALNFVQMPYAALQTAVPKGRARVSVGVQHFENDGVFYSDNFITFQNAAITKKSAGLTIDQIADLAGHEVLTWQDAYRELGPEFEKLFSPDSPQRGNYIEIADQEEQVRRFWESDAAVVVIDVIIFDYFSKQMGHSADEVEKHWLFAPVTDFRVAFADEDLRDFFDRNLGELCESGGYGEILERYRVVLSRTVCDP